MSLKTTRNSGYKPTGEVLKRDYGFDEAFNIFDEIYNNCNSLNI